MHRTMTRLACLFVLPTTALLAQATLHVPGQFATVQAALDAAAAGDTVQVAPGTYSGALTFPGRNVVLRGAGPAVTTLLTTTFDTVITCLPGSSRLAVIEGFTIRGGNGFEAGGIYCNQCSPTIRGNHIVENRTGAWGGGIGVYGGSPRIEDNLIADNLQSVPPQVSGGGISLRGAGSAEILHNRIERNVARNGGGISCFSAGTPRIEGNRIRANTAVNGGGIVFTNASDALVVQNVIDQNTASSGGGIHHTNGNIVVVNNTIVGNTGNGAAIYAYRPIAVLTLVNNVMTGGPVLLFGDLWRPEVTHVIANNLFHAPTVYGGNWPDYGGSNGNLLQDPLLRPDGLHLSANSPARDAGQARSELPGLDWFGDLRMIGNSVDLGVDEYSGTFPFGRACYGASSPEISATGWPQLGNLTFGFAIHGGLPLASALLVIGESTTTWQGAPLPRGLELYGLAVCLQLVSGLHSELANTDAVGFAVADCPIPNEPYLLGAVLHAQWGTLTAPIGLPSGLDGVSGGLSFEVH